MENTNQIIEPKDKKSSSDFMKLVIGIVVYGVVRIALEMVNDKE